MQGCSLIKVAKRIVIATRKYVVDMVQLSRVEDLKDIVMTALRKTCVPEVVTQRRKN